MLRRLTVAIAAVVAVLSLAWIVPARGSQNLVVGRNYLPLVQYPQPTPTPTLTPTATNTPEPTPTNTLEPTATEAPTNTPEPTNTETPTNTPEPTATEAPTATSEPPVTPVNCSSNPGSAPNTPVQITRIDKSAEVVSLRNVSGVTINLDGWTMCSIVGGQEHVGIGGTLEPNQTRSFPYLGSGNIWNNSSSDPGALYDRYGRLVSYYRD